MLLEQREWVVEEMEKLRKESREERQERAEGGVKGDVQKGTKITNKNNNRK